MAEVMEVRRAEDRTKGEENAMDQVISPVHFLRGWHGWPHSGHTDDDADGSDAAEGPRKLGEPS